MNKVTFSIAMSVDACVAGPNQRLEKPMGDIPENALHHWMFDEPEKHEAELASLVGAGAFIMGTNMFCPPDKRGDADWKGWWGENPPYHAPVFVLSATPKDPIAMEGGTTFTFITDGIHTALARAKEVAREKPILIAGGAHTINQFLAAGLIDEFWLHIAPITIGSGARLFEGITNLNLEPMGRGGTQLVTHIKYRVVKKQ